MALTRILLWLGNSLVLCAVMMAVTAFGAGVLGEMSYVLSFSALAMVTGVIGAVFMLLTHKTPARENNGDALIFLILFWLLMPVVTALPYVVVSSATGPGSAANFGIAYFESVSAITTTGASTLSADAMPRTLLFWRSLLQWFGGVSAATFAVVILAAVNLSGTGIHRSMLFTLKKGELFERLIGIGRVIGALYLVLSFLCFIALVIAGTQPFDALCLSLTSVSTGGLTPRDGVLAAYVGPAGAAILAVFCISGALSIAVLWDFVRLRGVHGLKPITQNIEHRGIFVIILVLTVFGIVFAGPAHIGTVIPEAVYFATSTGFDYHVIGIDMAPSAILVALALVGGAALSTTGGLKIIRLLLLFRHLGTDLSRLPHPSRIVPVIFRGRIVPDSAFLSIWMYFFGFTIAFAIGIVALGGVGIDFETSVAASAASLANMGPLLETSMTGTGFEDFTLAQLMVSSGLMLIGRVEVLAAFAAVFSTLLRR